MYTISQFFLLDVGTEIIATLCPMTGAIPKQWPTIIQHTTFVLEHCYLLQDVVSSLLGIAPVYCTRDSAEEEI